MKESKDIQLLFEGDRCTLSIREAYIEDCGIYKCVARNPHGGAESVCKLHVERKYIEDCGIYKCVACHKYSLWRNVDVSCL